MAAADLHKGQVGFTGHRKINCPVTETVDHDGGRVHAHLEESVIQPGLEVLFNYWFPYPVAMRELED